MTYKLTQGWPLHVESGAFVNPDMNADYLDWLAAGNVPLPADVPTRDIKAEIAALEKLHGLVRVVREFMLATFAAQATAAGVDPMTNIGYARVKELDDQIAALRRLIV